MAAVSSSGRSARGALTSGMNARADLALGSTPRHRTRTWAGHGDCWFRGPARRPVWAHPGFLEADDGDRTRDPQLGKLMLYQLSYVRDARRIAKSGTIGSTRDGLW